MLTVLAILLAAAVVFVSLSRRAGFGSIVGYLVAGVAIGPSGLRFVTDVHSISEISELGVLMLLFLIGLELRLPRIWAMRRSVFGLGLAQLLATGALLALAATLAGADRRAAVILGLGAALSSTAIVLPLLAERDLLKLGSGRDAFAVLLFQDLASVPLIAAVPLFAGHTASGPVWPEVVKAMVAVAAILLGGRYLVGPLFRAVGGVRTREVFTATALLVVAAAAALAGLAGLPMSLGAFAAGVVLSESQYRHELQADVEPFEGLLLGFFFMSVGMSADLRLAVREPANILLGVVGLLGIKAATAFVLGRLRGQATDTAVRFALAIPQGSEFAFVLFGAAVAAGALPAVASARATLVIALSMLASPVLFALSERWLMPRLLKSRAAPTVDGLSEVKPAPVLICGFGRFGQIVGRTLRARSIPFTAIDVEPEVIEQLLRFGHKVFYGDATRLDLLRGAGAAQARLIILALPDPEPSAVAAKLIRENFPDVRVLARARNRQHVYELRELGVQEVVRETFFSSLRLTELALRALGDTEAQARRTVQKFREHDEGMLDRAFAFRGDDAQLAQTSREAAAEFKTLLEADEMNG